MGKHRRVRTSKYKSRGKHRAVTPKSNLGRRTTLAVGMSLTLALYPAVAGDGEGSFPLLEDAIPILRQETAAAGEVITEPIDEPELPPVDELLRPLDGVREVTVGVVKTIS